MEFFNKLVLIFLDQKYPGILHQNSVFRIHFSGWFEGRRLALCAGSSSQRCGEALVPALAMEQHIAPTVSPAKAPRWHLGVRRGGAADGVPRRLAHADGAEPALRQVPRRLRCSPLGSHLWPWALNTQDLASGAEENALQQQQVPSSAALLPTRGKCVHTQRRRCSGCAARAGEAAGALAARHRRQLEDNGHSPSDPPRTPHPSPLSHSPTAGECPLGG